MIIEGSTLCHDLTLRTQVVVVGSGSGGAIMARELAMEGYDVLVLEEGPHVTPQEYGAWRPSKVMRKLYRAGGSMVAVGLDQGPNVGIMQGSCVGGGSVLTGGVCFRIPEHIHSKWSSMLGVQGLEYDAMLPYYERVEEMMHVHEVPDFMRSKSTTMFGQGVAKVGKPLMAMRRNTRGCTGQAKCNYGCPQQSKISVDLSYLPDACAHGAVIYSDMRCERILTDQGRATGVLGAVLGGPGRRPKHRFTIKSDHVVVCAGAIHTPLILDKSCVGRESKMVGRNLSIHPGFAVPAFFDEPIKLWQGAMQSAFTHHPEDERLLFVSVASPPNLLAGFLPGFGQQLMHHAKHQLEHMAIFGGMVHDDSSGRVFRGLGREPIVTYKMSERDKSAFKEGVRFTMRAFLEAGAHTVMNPFVGAPLVHSIAELEVLDFSSYDMNRAQSLSYHPLGTAGMGVDRKHAVVDPRGESFELKNLWVADGSVFPSSVGVNAQLPIMAMTTRIAFEMMDEISRR